jgi:hypothetical protein
VSRVTAVRIVAVAAVIVLWLPALGLVDLTTSWFLEETTIVHDLGYGAITGLLVPAGLIAQLRSPGRAVAGLQQVGACAIAYAVAGAIADSGYFVLAGFVAAVLAVLLVLHPVGGTFLAAPDDVSTLLAGLALVAAVPFTLYALDAAEKQREGAFPVDFHAHLGSWAGLTAMGVGIVLVAALAALRTTGWSVPVWSAAGAAAVWGVGCVTHPDVPGSEGRVWGALAVAWAIAFVLAGRREARATAPTE